MICHFQYNSSSKLTPCILFHFGNHILYIHDFLLDLLFLYTPWRILLISFYAKPIVLPLHVVPNFVIQLSNCLGHDFLILVSITFLSSHFLGCLVFVVLDFGNHFYLIGCVELLVDDLVYDIHSTAWMLSDLFLYPANSIFHLLIWSNESSTHYYYYLWMMLVPL